MAERVTRQYTEVLGQGTSKDRVTRQYVEVLGQGTSKARVTRQYVEVLGAANIIEKLILDTFTFTEVAYQNIKRETVSESLVFTDYAPAIYSATVNDSLSFIEHGSRTHVDSLSDSLVILDDDATNYIIINDFCPGWDTLVFEELVAGIINNKPIILESLILSEVISIQQPVYVSIFDLLVTLESINHGAAVIVSVTDTLTLNGTCGMPIPVSVTEILTIYEEGSRLNYRGLDSLAFTETISAGRGYNITDNLTLTQTVICLGIFKRTASENLNVGYSLTYFLNSSCIDTNYSPLVGESNVLDQPTPPSDSLPSVQGLPVNTRFLISYPATGFTTDSVSLRAPLMENKDALAFNRVNRETRGGKLSIFADPIWPKVNTLNLTFSGLTNLEIASFQNFAANYLGEEIRITDWFGRDWVGVITKPNQPITHDGKSDNNLNFEFEGVLVGRVVPGNNLNLTELVSAIVITRPLISDTLTFFEGAYFRVN